MYVTLKNVFLKKKEKTNAFLRGKNECPTFFFYLRDQNVKVKKIIFSYSNLIVVATILKGLIDILRILFLKRVSIFSLSK